jgi:hypothetical protein
MAYRLAGNKEGGSTETKERHSSKGEETFKKFSMDEKREEKQLLERIKIKGPFWSDHKTNEVKEVHERLLKFDDENRLPVMRMVAQLYEWSPEAHCNVHSIVNLENKEFSNRIEKTYNDTKKLTGAGLFPATAFSLATSHNISVTDELTKDVSALRNVGVSGEYTKDLLIELERKGYAFTAALDKFAPGILESEKSGMEAEKTALLVSELKGEKAISDFNELGAKKFLNEIEKLGEGLHWQGGAHRVSTTQEESWIYDKVKALHKIAFEKGLVEAKRAKLGLEARQSAQIASINDELVKRISRVLSEPKKYGANEENIRPILKSILASDKPEFWLERIPDLNKLSKRINSGVLVNITSGIKNDEELKTFWETFEAVGDSFFKQVEIFPYTVIVNKWYKDTGEAELKDSHEEKRYAEVVYKEVFAEPEGAKLVLLLSDKNTQLEKRVKNARDYVWKVIDDVGNRFVNRIPKEEHTLEHAPLYTAPPELGPHEIDGAYGGAG